MTFEIRFTPESSITYLSVVTQLQERWGEKFVLRFEAKVKKSIKTISFNPYLYAVADEALQLRRCILHKNCSMLYRIYDEKVVIVVFWDNRQDPLFK